MAGGHKRGLSMQFELDLLRESLGEFAWRFHGGYLSFLAVPHLSSLSWK
jgi:hypothetical protein